MCRARQPVTRNSLKSDVASGPIEIDPLYLFLSAVECSKRGSGEAAWELLGPPDIHRSGDSKPRSRCLEQMLTRGSTWKGSSFWRFPLTQQ